ncbi:heat-inducible transcriptional repressor HrcA [Oceanomicrobium pacificus]|uniref:Heat-inducible transcription repressor HrcA n=1 Tax=Oceanomicrobium pacificus TaxID=2692916 RepID=A0A6B0TU05_9RHOB|nr:heat-inducible transcriptional repressor HrcA [Oceanomicrobium pacificus]MXU64704.1 heat-inducible transcriptional repressor HrcA [Oceanomicrobium pacificus]
MSTEKTPLSELNDRSREVFRRVVETYLASGEPVGSRTLSRALEEQVSAATVRNVMQDLEYLGLLGSPHVSAGRVPTDLGLRLFVDGLLEVTDVSGSERDQIDRSLGSTGPDAVTDALDRAGTLLSGLTQGASLVLAPKEEAPIRHIEFVSLAPDRALVVLVFAGGQVENRVFKPPLGLTPSAMQEAANFLNTVLEGRTLAEARGIIAKEIKSQRAALDEISQRLVEEGVATWADAGEDRDRLIVRGRANLLDEARTEQDLARIRMLFDDLERKRDLEQLLSLSEGGEGVRVFIGSENKLFSLSGSSLVVSPYMNTERKIIGAVGVIGPTRLNYGRIVPIVDYTAQLIGKLVSRQSG